MMGIMEAVYPITGLYWGPVMLWFYFRRGRKKSPKWQEEHPDDQEDLGREVAGSPWWSTSKGDAHCGAGCTLGDICGEWLVWLVAWSIPIFGYFAANELWKPPLMFDSPEYWFMMQLSMIVGYFTAWPVNAWLIKKGVKEKM
ncbi:MAG: DUF4396 domain-containing protein [Actinomycetota bacterium]|nr:DUF4396 domain-containing protein [Actinomycetota bacterium]